MRPILVGILAAAAAIASGCSPPPRPEVQMVYPETRREAVADTIHGREVSDPYRWLEDAEQPEVREWMDRQDALTRARLGGREARAALVSRLRELVYLDAVSVPQKKGDRLFLSRKAKDAEKAVYFFRDGLDGEERLLLDPLALAADGSVSIGLIAPSHDGRLVAFTRRERGADEATLQLIEADSGRVLTDRIEGAKYASPQWTPDGSGFFYTRLPVDPAIPVDRLPGHAEIRFHPVGGDPAKDPLIHPATLDPTRFLAPQLSKDGRWLFAYVMHGWSSNDVFVRDLADPSAAFRPFVTGRDARYTVIPWRDAFFVQTDEGAPFGRVFRVDPAHPEREAWVEVVPEQDGATIQEVRIHGGHLVVESLHSVASEIRVFGLDGRLVRRVELPGLGTIGALAGDEEDDDAFFSFSSFTDPPRIYRLSVASGALSLWAEIAVPVDPAPFTVKQVFYPSEDGTEISMFLVHREDLHRDGSHPVLLSGYGGFSVNVTSTFSAVFYPWLERGGVLAFPNLRGGGEYGEAWHRAGMQGRKQNTFDDFIAAAEWLVAEGYTTSERLAIRGGSNGGLLVGAVVTQRPGLFRAAICAVPLLDMIRYHLFGSGRTWIAEYGSAEDPAQFATLYAYSPYHKVDPKARYPALLMLSADGDDRVDPMHARKMAAALQASAGAVSRPVLLRVERNAGHGGADLRRQEVEYWADVYAFLLWQLAME